jgi:hypothetical protein
MLSGILLILFVTKKSATSSFTHDESYSYTRYVHTGFMDIISFKNPSPNNHILNTLLMKFSEKIFGPSELALRLPNIFFLAVYLFFSFMIFRKTNPVLAVCMFILMIANPYLVDFFGLARGYGLAIGFMVMSFYFLLKFMQQRKNKDLVIFNLTAFFAALCHLSLIYFYISSLIIINLLVILEHYIYKIPHEEKFNFFRLNKTNIILFIFSSAILYEPIRKYIKFKLADFGGKEGFLHDTVGSLINAYFYDAYSLHASANINAVFKIFILTVVFTSLFLFLWSVIRRNAGFFVHHMPLIIINLILFLTAIGTIIQHYAFRSDYIIIRFALFLFPLFILNLGFLIHYLMTFKFHKAILVLAVILSLSSAVNLIIHTNSYSYYEWEYDTETKRVMKEIIADHEKYDTDKKNIKIGISWVFEPTMNFYRQTWKLDWLQPLDRNRLHVDDDYVYMFNPDTARTVVTDHPILFSSKRIHATLYKMQ